MKKYSLILLTFLALLGTSCSKSFLAVNEVNPNSASAVPPKLVLPAALSMTVDITDRPGNFEFVYLWYGCWAISSSYSPNTPMLTYNLTSLYGTASNNWTNFYLAAKNFDYIVQQSKDPDSKPYRGIGRVMKAYIFQNLVDTWGDVPYSEAFQTDKGILKPKYDAAQSIYEDLVSQLDSAINDFQTTPPTAILPGASQDIVYAGDLGLWTRFANTLKLRILLRQSNMAGRAGYITSHITNSAGYLGAGESALVNPPYVASANKQNPRWDEFYDPAGSARDGGLNYYVPSQDVIDFFQSTGDTARLARYCTPGSSAAGNYIGAYYGQTVGLPSSGNMATIGTGILQSYSQPGTLMTDCESLFLQAEAAQRGIITGSAQTLYESAVAASFAYLGVADPSIATGYLSQGDSIPTNPKVSFNVATDKVNLILSQKWAAMNMIAPVEIWSDWRRTGFPNFIHFTQRLDRKNPTPPVRLFYPQTEISYNTENENAAEKGGINVFTTKIFWQP